MHGVAGASPASVIYPANARIPMHNFEDIKPGARLLGLDPAGIAEVVQVARFGPDALNLVFRVNGRVGERLVYRGEESSFELLETGRSYAFDADGSLLRLASEAYRIRLAYLFDPYLAVSASHIEALPHQITAVYGEMLQRQPLRFLLADWQNDHGRFLPQGRQWSPQKCSPRGSIGTLHRLFGWTRRTLGALKKPSGNEKDEVPRARDCHWPDPGQAEARMGSDMH